MTVETVVSVVSGFVASLSLCFSVFTYVRDNRLKKRADEQERKLKELQLALSEIRLRREAEEERKRSESKVEARHVSVGPKKHKLRVANTGWVTVANVTCEVVGEAGPYDLMQDKEPYERLEPGESFDEWMILAMGCASKFTVVTRWTDPDGKECSRENIVSV